MDENKDIPEGILRSINNLEEDITEKQLKILEAAILVFSEKGFEGSRTSDIAKEADVAEGTIFRYYKTKKDLLMGIMFPLVTKFFRPLIMRSAEQIVKNQADKPTREVLKAVFLDRLKLVRKNMPLIKIVVVESLYHPELLKPIQEKLMPEIVGFVDSIINKNIKEGNFREVDARLITRTSMSLLAGYLILTTVYPDMFPTENDETEVEKIVDVLLNGVIKKGEENNA
jgi:AcrR family transcriptional regulator